MSQTFTENKGLCLPHPPIYLPKQTKNVGLKIFSPVHAQIRTVLHTLFSEARDVEMAKKSNVPIKLGDYEDLENPHHCLFTFNRFWYMERTGQRTRAGIRNELDNERERSTKERHTTLTLHIIQLLLKNRERPQ